MFSTLTAFHIFLVINFLGNYCAATNGFGVLQSSDDALFIESHLLSAERRKREQPSVPFPESLSNEIQKAMDEDPKLFPESPFNETEGYTEVTESTVNMEELCTKFMPIAQLYCAPGKTLIKLMSRCKDYFKDCIPYIGTTDPLFAIANSFNSGVGLNLGTLQINGIPYYPMNEEGSFGIGQVANIPFGSWGGGFTSNSGVRDFWSQVAEAGGNWYEGKYGARTGWSVPAVQSLGVEGNSGVGVSVPIKEGDLGKPVTVDVGGGVGPYYQQNNHVGVDWLNGAVRHNIGFGIPLVGLGVNSGWGFNFPAVAALARAAKAARRQH